tara:strand:+ start:2301 stop:2708 length:408 start_codon:yes stop_codon:yes gene_type:complete
MATLSNTDLTVTDVNCTNLKDASGGNSSTPANILSGTVKAWVNMDGSGTAHIDTSFNMTSITDNGTGVYTLTIATDFGSADWVAAGMCGTENTTTHIIGTGNTAPTAGTIKIQTVNDGGGAIDCPHIMVMMIGDQ